MSSTRVICSAGWEEFKVGDFVICLRDKFYKDTVVRYNGYERLEFDNVPADYSGMPSEILGVSLPYLVIKYVVGGNNATVDLRRWDFAICDRKYVEAFVEEGHTYIPVKGKPIINTMVVTQTGIEICPKCRNKMISFRPERVQIGYSNWSYRCKDCKIECREYE